jgi:polyhydroxybutyrate depolymerase
MKRGAVIAVVLVGFCFFLGFKIRQSRMKTMLSRTIQIGGRQREYLVSVPPQSDETSPLPVVLVFHGGGGQATGMESLTGFSALGQRERFIVVYPQGVGRSWNDGRITEVSQAHREKIDDLGFVDAMLAALSRAYPVDLKRVYATGISNGGIFSHYLAASRAQRIAAIAPVVGGIADPFHQRFKPAQPVSVLMIQGTKDPLAPYAGGPITGGDGKDRGRIISTQESARLWVKNNGCTSSPTVTSLPDRDPGDGCTVQRYVWAKGKAGTEVQLLRVEQGGHTWPNGPQYLPQPIIGRVCRDFDATREIWSFFKAHHLP